MSAKDTVESLYEQMKELEASEIHFQIESIFGNKQATAVISVYDGVKPAHKVLEELYYWAQENQNQELLDKIEEISEDLSFLDEKEEEDGV